MKLFDRLKSFFCKPKDAKRKSVIAASEIFNTGVMAGWAAAIINPNTTPEKDYMEPTWDDDDWECFCAGFDAGMRQAMSRMENFKSTPK